MNEHKGLKFIRPYQKDELLEMSYKIAEGLPLFVTTVKGVIPGDDAVLYMESDEFGNAILFAFETQAVGSNFSSVKAPGIKRGTTATTRIMAHELIDKCSALMKETKEVESIKIVICRNKDGHVVAIDELWSSITH